MGEFLPSPRYTGGGLYGTIVYTSPCDVRRRDSTSSRKKPTPQPRRWCSTPLHEKPVPQEPPKQPEHRAAAEKDARKHWTPEGYSLTHWDPTEQPILLLGSVFDANSLGKWIYDWTVCKHGKGHPIAQIAGELWLLLIEFSGKIKGADEIIPSIRQKKVRKMPSMDAFIRETFVQQLLELFHHPLVIIFNIGPDVADKRPSQVGHTESIPFSVPMSRAALHTIQPAHLPLISFPSFTTVEWVVIDMGSIHSSSE
ncbi:hypothetical protein RB593_001658 [Gaeumannomyces tritici]